jgi:hypothetical protein
MVMAFIYTKVGDYDEAIDMLDYLLTIESWATPEYLRAEPIFAPLQDLPRFNSVLSKHKTARL